MAQTEEMNALAVQFDVEDGVAAKTVVDAVKAYLLSQGHAVSFKHGEKHDWAGFVRAGDVRYLATLGEEVQRFLTDLGGVTFQSVFLAHVPDAYRAPVVLQSGPRQRPSGLAERLS
jgi:hypothetical protein